MGSKAKKSSVKRKKQAGKDNSHRIVEEHAILDGDVKLIRTTKSGKFWSMSCWLREEGKCYRRSLRTRDLDNAKILAKKEYYRLQGQIDSGNRIFSKTAEELVDEYVAHKLKRANGGFITHGRVSTIKISLNRWFLNYVGRKTKINKIKAEAFEEYYVWRREKASDVRNATLINERALISSLFKYGILRGYLKFEQTPIFEDLKIKKGEIERRDALDIEEWRQVYRSFRRWLSKAKDAKEKEQRAFIRDFIIISIHTGLRFGELRKLKWRMIKTYEVDRPTARSDTQTHVEISVPVDTKTGARNVTGRRGDVFHRIKKRSNFKKHDDWVFVDNDTGDQIHKKVYYKQWQSLMKECGLIESNKKLSYYSLRHTYITYRLLCGTNIFILSENVGTSIRNIELHYAHVKSDKTRRELTKELKSDAAGQVLLGDEEE